LVLVFPLHCWQFSSAELGVHAAVRCHGVSLFPNFLIVQETVPSSKLAWLGLALSGLSKE
jgi:hypothetical protein